MSEVVIIIITHRKSQTGSEGELGLHIHTPIPQASSSLMAYPLEIALVSHNFFLFTGTLSYVMYFMKILLKIFANQFAKVKDQYGSLHDNSARECHAFHLAPRS